MVTKIKTEALQRYLLFFMLQVKMFNERNYKLAGHTIILILLSIDLPLEYHRN